MDISHTSRVVELEARKSHKHYNPFNQNTWVVLQPKCFDKKTLSHLNFLCFNPCIYLKVVKNLKMELVLSGTLKV